MLWFKLIHITKEALGIMMTDILIHDKHSLQRGIIVSHAVHYTNNQIFVTFNMYRQLQLFVAESYNPEIIIYQN